MNNFEVHITVEKVDGLDEAAVSLGCKVLYIELDKGETPFQPMLTFKIEDTRLSNVEIIVQEYLRRLSDFNPIRVKIESEFKPESYLYTERHIKIPAVWVHGVRELGGHISRNENKGTYFVTERNYDESLLSLLLEKGVPVLKVDDEFVISDTNLDLDKGWLCQI